ncbi:MAG: hypothetical protein KAG26_08420 [Methylococcales bacterium]|nr:hypothetical protein [Methylococcales bacterium]
MKKVVLVFMLGSLGLGIQSANAQSMSKSLGLHVFPANNQDQATQEVDEAECYKWAINQTGYDPINPTVVQAEQVDTSADGTAVKSSARSAAGGAAIGAIAGDAGKGAAIGATVGGVRGIRAKKGGDAQQQQANDQAAATVSGDLKTDYNNAFSACMEGKGYSVK